MARNVMDLRRGFAEMFAPSLPVMPQPDPGAAAGGAGWDAAWERRARSVLGSANVGTREDLMDPEHRKWINRKLRKKRGQTTVSPPKPEKASKVASVEEAPTPPEPKTVGESPIVRPGYLVNRALRPHKPTGAGRPTRGMPYA